MVCFSCCFRAFVGWFRESHLLRFQAAAASCLSPIPLSVPRLSHFSPASF
uniref:Uncharacterized protein n=1 Tax=Arundo donax TaxID=35708 RepID=A0A0A9F6G8_ARUDO